MNFITARNLTGLMETWYFTCRKSFTLLIHFSRDNTFNLVPCISLSASVSGAIGYFSRNILSDKVYLQLPTRLLNIFEVNIFKMIVSNLLKLSFVCKNYDQATFHLIFLEP